MNNLNFDDLRSDELKEFMILWNQFTLETDVTFFLIKCTNFFQFSKSVAQAEELTMLHPRRFAKAMYETLATRCLNKTS